MAGRLSPSARALDAKLCRRSCSRTPPIPAIWRMTCRESSRLRRCLRGTRPAMTNGFPSLRGMPTSISAASGDNTTVHAPVLVSSSFNCPAARSTFDHFRMKTQDSLGGADRGRLAVHPDMGFQISLGKIRHGGLFRIRSGFRVQPLPDPVDDFRAEAVDWLVPTCRSGTGCTLVPICMMAPLPRNA